MKTILCWPRSTFVFHQTNKAGSNILANMNTMCRIIGRGDDTVGNPHRAHFFFNSSFSSSSSY